MVGDVFDERDRAFHAENLSRRPLRLERTHLRLLLHRTGYRALALRRVQSRLRNRRDRIDRAVRTVVEHGVAKVGIAGCDYFAGRSRRCDDLELRDGLPGDPSGWQKGRPLSEWVTPEDDRRFPRC